MPTPAETLEQSLAKLQTANRIDGNRNSYRKDMAVEYTKVIAYLQGGARPTGVISDMGMGLMLAEDARRGLNALPVPPDPPPVGLGVDRATMLATGGAILREDNSAQADPLTGLWGEFSNNTASRHVHHTTGGDPRPKADGTPQGNSSYREINVVPGDSWQGESAQRSELGRNTCTPYYTANGPGQTSGTFWLYDQGQHRITFFSQRFHDNFIFTQNNWQLTFQHKQDQPYVANGPVDTAPALTITFYDGLIHVENFWTVRWTTPAPIKNAWIRFALEVFYSTDPSKGWFRLYVDRDGDGDFLDANEMSPQVFCQTLATVTSADPAKVANGARAVGQPLPSHMRMGIYRQQTYTSPGTMDIDNVQIVG